MAWIFCLQPRFQAERARKNWLKPGPQTERFTSSRTLKDGGISRAQWLSSLPSPCRAAFPAVGFWLAHPLISLMALGKHTVSKRAIQ
jgi:hypothetical protein